MLLNPLLRSGPSAGLPPSFLWRHDYSMPQPDGSGHSNHISTTRTVKQQPGLQGDQERAEASLPRNNNRKALSALDVGGEIRNSGRKIPKLKRTKTLRLSSPQPPLSLRSLGLQQSDDVSPLVFPGPVQRSFPGLQAK